jgi:hypothetical protein
LQNLHQASGVIAVGVGRIDPPQISGLDLRPERLKEIRPRGRQATVHQQWLLGVHDVGIDGQEPEAGYRLYVG